MCAPCKVILDCHGGLAVSASTFAARVRAAGTGVDTAIQADALAAAAGHVADAFVKGFELKNFNADDTAKILAYTAHACDVASEIDEMAVTAAPAVLEEYRMEILKTAREIALAAEAHADH